MQEAKTEDEYRNVVERISGGGVMNRTQVFSVALLVVLAAWVAACGTVSDGRGSVSMSGGDTSTSVTIAMSAGTTAATVMPAAAAAPPEGLKAVIGVTATVEPGPGVLWRWGPGGICTTDVILGGGLHSEEVAVGRHGSIVACSDSASGNVRLWNPDEGSVEEIPVPAPTGGWIFWDRMALSPDESTLALVRSERSETDPAGVADWAIHGYLIDVESKQLESWGQLGCARRGADIYSLVWDKDSTSIYVTFDSQLTGWGDRSWRYEVSTGESEELAGLPIVMDVGPQGQVLGYDCQADSARLVLWRDGESVVLPRDPGLETLSTLGWISDDGKTIVAWGWTPPPEQACVCLEVLKLRDTGWEVSWLYAVDESMEIVDGIGFERGSGVFWLEARPVLAEGEYLTDMHLFRLDTDTNQATVSGGLPGDPHDRSRVLGIVGAEG